MEWDPNKAYYSPREVALHLGISMAKLATYLNLFNLRVIPLPGNTEGISAKDVRELEENSKQEKGK
jgi:hypothetical protein